MEPSKEPIAVRITRLNRQILGKVSGGASKLKKTVDREALLDALTVLYDECNDDPVKKCDDLVKAFVDKYRSTLAELRRTRVCLSDFDVLQTIGRGHFGEVHMVREKQTGDVYAMKTLKKDASRRREAGTPEDEREVLATARSHWLPRLQYAFQDSSTLYLVMELCTGGDLAGLLSRRNHPLSEQDAAFYVAEVAHALKTVHGMGYVHRDVKPHNILLDRCGHVKLGDLGSSTRLSDGGWQSAAALGTPDYVAPELLAAAHCAQRHTVCVQFCQGAKLDSATAISACDYWSLGVVAFELVTLKRPFSSDDEDSVAQILANIQKYERSEDAPPFDPLPYGPSSLWRSLVAGLLRTAPSQRYNYLDTLQHDALAHVNAHSIRDQPPPWVPCTRGLEDASHFAPPPRAPAPPRAAPFRQRAPYAGQLPFLGFSYVAPEEQEENSGGFNASHDCTAIDMATFKSSEKLAIMRAREVASLQNKVASLQGQVAAAEAAAERGRVQAEAESEAQRARLQAEVTALTVQNKRLERQVEVEKEERLALERTNQQLTISASERTGAEVRAAQASAAAAAAESCTLRAELAALGQRLADAQAEAARASTAADAARQQQRHYKDSIAKERALRRQTLTGGEAEREAAARVTQAEAAAAREARARDQAERRAAALEAELAALRTELDGARKEMANIEESLGEKRRVANTSSEQLKEAQVQLAQEKMRVSSLLAQVQELQRTVSEARGGEAALEEQCARTEARLHERLEAAEARAAAALQDDVRHREKVNTLEQLVRQLEREVGALEKRACAACAARDAHSDTESVADTHTAAQVSLLKEQLERAEAQLQARTEEIAALRQETRTANLSRWRKERELNDLTSEMKTKTRELKRAEERLSAAIEAKKAAEEKAAALQTENEALKPQHERVTREAERAKQQLEKLQKVHETVQAEVNRSRNDIRKLKSELQYSEKRRLHAEEQEELSSRERAQLRDECTQLRVRAADLEQNNKALQEACSLLEEQLTDLEKLADIHEIKNKDLEDETARMRGELELCRTRLGEAERAAAERGTAANLAAQQHDDAREQARHAHCQLQLLRERLENRETRVADLEARIAGLEGELSSAEASLSAAARRVRDLQEECAALRTRAHTHHAHALQLQGSLDDVQEELSRVREASEAAAAWWRTRETKADATLRQQAKLIDFLQAKVEEASRKKCSFSHKLFGRSGRRAANSPPLRRSNRELRDEVEKLRAKLAGSTLPGERSPPSSEKKKPPINGKRPVENGDALDDERVQIIWPDGVREKMYARTYEGVLVLARGDKEMKARLLSAEAKNLPQNEANRAFTIGIDNGSTKLEEAVIVCSSSSRRQALLGGVPPPPPQPAPPLYRPHALCTLDTQPNHALYIAPNAIAIGCVDGLYSLRGPVNIDVESESPRGRAIHCLAGAEGRVLMVLDSSLVHGSLLALGSALRRAASLAPAVSVTKVRLPDLTPPNIVKAMREEVPGGGVAAVAVSCGRRVVVSRWHAAAAEFRVARALTVDRAPADLLLTPRALYIAGERPLRLTLPAGALEHFAADDPAVSAAAKRHSPPRAILLIRTRPIEILLCYTECGVFVDEAGRRSRNEDPKWSSAVHGWLYVAPFLYLVGEDRVTIIYVTDEAYRAPPCTCDSASVASTASECFMPDVYNLKVRNPHPLGTTPNGIIIRIREEDDSHSVCIVEGMAAFKSIGASVESLLSISDHKGSTSDLGISMVDLAAEGQQNDAPDIPQDQSRESVDINTGFLADIRKRAKQLRMKNRREPSAEDVIKEILTTEVGLKRTSNGRKSPAMISDYDSDSDGEMEPNGTDSTRNTAEVCGELFARQVRFQ